MGIKSFQSSSRKDGVAERTWFGSGSLEAAGRPSNIMAANGGFQSKDSFLIWENEEARFPKAIYLGTA